VRTDIVKKPELALASLRGIAEMCSGFVAEVRMAACMEMAYLHCAEDCVLQG
jgi:hypothetical protein